MSGSIDERLRQLGIELPAAAAPAANYVPYVITGSLLSISGQLPMKDGTLGWKGQVGGAVSVEDGQAAARQCAINIIAQARAALEGDLDRVARIVRLGGFVSCGADFGDQPKVINGASDLMVAVFGDKGRHSRAAVGVSALPFGASVEVDALIEIA